MSEFIRPFGPTIYHGKLTKDEVWYLQQVAQETKKARQNVGSDLAGNIKDQLGIVVEDQSKFMEVVQPHIAKFLQYEDKKKYGFFLKFYKKRFMHIVLKSYLGTLENSNNNIKIFIDVEKRIFDNEIHFFDHPHFGVIVSINGI